MAGSRGEAHAGGARQGRRRIWEVGRRSTMGIQGASGVDSGARAERSNTVKCA